MESSLSSAHKIGRCVYYMLKNQKVFDEKRFLAG